MKPRILVVDDDQTFLRLTEKGLEDFEEMFSVRTASDGQTALEMLKTDHIMLLVTDLRMPGIDGFELLNRISSQYPDIPVIIFTAHDRPKTREVVLKSGAADYLTKPLEGAKLATRIIKILKKKAEGGTLHNVNLETYLQLVEMEQQTCTLRIIDKSQGKMGVLFFREGDLMDARLGDIKGREAAYKILSWSGASLSIENACVIESKQINGELQAIILDAMRNKDEILDVEGELQRDEFENEGAILLDNPVQEESPIVPAVENVIPEAESSERPAAESVVEATPEPELTPVEIVRKKLAGVRGLKNGGPDVYMDSQWNGLIEQAVKIGELIDAGTLNVVCIKSGRNGQLIIVPGDEPIVAVLGSDMPRERLIAALA